MKSLVYFRITSLTMVVSMILLTACMKEDENTSFQNGDPESGTLLKSGQNGAATYIVVLNDDFEAAAELKGIQGYDRRKEVMTGYLNRYLKGKGIGNEQVEHVFSTVYMGFSAKLSEPQLEKLQQDRRVKSVEPDQVIALGKPGPPPPPQPDQIIDWGVARVGGPFDGTGKTAWVIDSGIDFEHPDLKVNTRLSRNFVLGENKNKGDDGYGHGTAVSGHLAAINNSIGCVGVAAGATLVAIRVLNDSGSGSVSCFIAGIDYVAATAAPGDVVNISLISLPNVNVDNAVLALGKKGIKVAIAAGNDGTAVSGSPNRLDAENIYTVAAMDKNDQWPSFSNYGPHVDFCAPGVQVYTTHEGGTYVMGEYTSSAAPHVAGLLLLGPVNTDGYVYCPKDGQLYPIAHR